MRIEMKYITSLRNIRVKWKSCLIGKLEKEISGKVIWHWYGMLEEKTKGNMASLTTFGWGLLELLRSKVITLSFCRIWRESIPHCLLMGSTWSTTLSIERFPFIHRFILPESFILHAMCICFNRDSINPRRRHMYLQVLCNLQEEAVPSWSRCCNMLYFW